jgi:hypothetical protein
MGKYKDLDQLAAAVPANEALEVTGLDLRDADGAKRLASGVRERIAQRLQDRGLGFFPPGELPDWHEEKVYLFRLGSPLGSLIGAVTNPTPMGLKLLRQAVSPTAAATKEHDILEEALGAINDARSLLESALPNGDEKDGDG